ncbi:hypothetical protein Hanom_Chr15g01406471 [Helianthus anomalus]
MFPGRLLFPPESSGVDTKHPILYLIFYISASPILIRMTVLFTDISILYTKKK